MTDFNEIRSRAELGDTLIAAVSLLIDAVELLTDKADKRLCALESREASLPGAIGHMIRLHLEGSVDLEAMKPHADAKLTALALAIRFHETYERLAPSFGYETRTDTRQFDPESKNGRLMVAVCGELAGLIPAAPQVAGRAIAEDVIPGQLADILTRVHRLAEIADGTEQAAGLLPEDGSDAVAVQWVELGSLANAYLMEHARVARYARDLDSAREAERGAKEKLRIADGELDMVREELVDMCCFVSVDPGEEQDIGKLFEKLRDGTREVLRQANHRAFAPTPAAPCASPQPLKFPRNAGGLINYHLVESVCERVNAAGRHRDRVEMGTVAAVMEALEAEDAEAIESLAETKAVES